MRLREKNPEDACTTMQIQGIFSILSGFDAPVQITIHTGAENADIHGEKNTSSKEAAASSIFHSTLQAFKF
jgi:hypothetical protein